jgi:hypothetical protein
VLHSSEENKRPFVPKKNCYNLEIPNKDAPEDMKYMSLTLETAI